MRGIIVGGETNRNRSEFMPMLPISERFRTYLSAALKGVPVSPPQASLREWEDLISSLRSHWVLPFLSWQISRFPAACRPPAPIMEHFKRALLWSRLRALRMESQLREIVAAFGDAGVETLILKGQALAWTHYPDPTTRPASDIDLLVRSGQFDQARHVMEKLNYRSVTRTFTGIFRDVHCEENYVRNNGAHRHGDLSVELHWELDPFATLQRPGATDGLFARAIKVQAPSFAFRTLQPVDALLHGALHMVKHAKDNRLIWIRDLALLSEGLSVPDDWRALQERSVAWRARGAVEEALREVAVWDNRVLPPGFDDFSTWPAPSEEERSWGQGVPDDRLIGRMRRYWLACRANASEGSVALIRFWYRVLFPDAETIRLGYPPSHPWLLPVSYVRRWLRWITRV